MKNKLLGNFHWIFFLMAAMNLLTIYEEKSLIVENTKMSIEGLKGKKISQERKLKSIKKFKENLSQSKDRVKEVVKQIEKTQKQLPSEVNDTVVATSISELADSLKMQNIGISPLAEELNGFYFTKNYNVRVDATFLQAIIMFENLEKSERILNVKGFEIKDKNTVTRGRFKVLSVETNIESYRYNSNYKEKSGVEEIENKFQVP